MSAGASPRTGARANFLRACTVGAKVRFRAWWCPDWTERTVTVRQTNRVAFSHPTKRYPDGSAVDCWLDFPKAAEVDEPEPGRFMIGDPAFPRLEYDFREL